MKVYLEARPNHYDGDYPSITIHYRPKEKADAERLKSLIETTAESQNERCICATMLNTQACPVHD